MSSAIVPPHENGGRSYQVKEPINAIASTLAQFPDPESFIALIVGRLKIKEKDARTTSVAVAYASTLWRAGNLAIGIARRTQEYARKHGLSTDQAVVQLVLTSSEYEKADKALKSLWDNARSFEVDLRRAGALPTYGRIQYLQDITPQVTESQALQPPSGTPDSTDPSSWPPAPPNPSEPPDSPPGHPDSPATP